MYVVLLIFYFPSRLVLTDLPVEMSTYPITGIQINLDRNQNDPFRRVEVRREVDQWWFSQDPVDKNQQALFIQAMIKFQQMSPRDKLSYFQVAGIHGQPLTTWDESTKNGQGYCVHGTPLCEHKALLTCTRLTS